MKKSPAPTTLASLVWDEAGQPKSALFDDFYFSSDNGIAETRYVYIDNNQLQQRWQQPLEKPVFSIGETGFGTGLNFLVAWQLWRTLNPQHQNLCQNQQNTSPARLHYFAVEKYPLTKTDLAQALALWPTLAPLSEQLLKQYPPQPVHGSHRLQFDDGRLQLTLFFGDATEGLTQCAPNSTLGQHASNQYAFSHTPFHTPSIDAWFLDGFSPAKNPDMWTPQLFNAVAALSQKGTTFATFTSARLVQDGLSSVGFLLRKLSGFGLKRQMLAGEMVSPVQEAPPPAPKKKSANADHYWHLMQRSKTLAVDNTVLIIGGGLAGCQAASALAKRGFNVTLLEQNKHLASEASGNRQGVVYTRLSPHPDPLSEFNLAAQIFANQFYQRENAVNSGSLFKHCGNKSGVIHLAITEKQRLYYQQLAETFSNSENFCRWLNTQEVADFSGVASKHSGLLVPDAGWIAPARLCETLVQHPNISVITQCHVAQIERAKSHWRALDDNGNSIASAGTAVIANASAAKQFEQTAHLPLKPIRGQVSHLSHAPKNLQTLKTVLCGEGYISPALDNIHCIGASFNLDDDNKTLTERDHQTNLQNLEQMVDIKASAIDTMLLDGRVGFRTTTPDYFPLVGPAPDKSKMLVDFDSLRHKANAVNTLSGSYHKGLYTLLGLGSRGLAYSPLAAELLACLLAGEPLPVRQPLYLKLHPARFLIRNLIRNKTSTL